MKETPITPEDLDVLRELSNIGAGHATTSLWRLLGRGHITLRVPRAELAFTREVVGLMDASEPIVGVSLEVSGLLSGAVLIAFAERDARALAGLLVGDPSALALDEMGRSALMEVGNVLTSAYVSALAPLLGGPLVPSPPSLVEGVIGEVVARALAVAAGPGAAAHPAPAEGGAAAAESPEIVTLVNEFVIEDERFFGYFLLFPHPGSLRACLRAARSN